MLAVWFGHANASTVFAGGALLLAVVVAVVPLRGRAVPAVALGALVPLLFLTTVAYVGDHANTARDRAAWAASPPDWIDATGLGRANFLVLPFDPPYFAWTNEAWNRDFGRPIRMDVEDPRTDPFAASHASVRADGVLLVDGKPAPAGLLVVNDFGSQLDLDGRVVAHPRPGLRELRVPAAPRVRSFAEGLYHDGWGAPRITYTVWPGSVPGGHYELGLALPADSQPREFSIRVGDEGRVLRLGPGESTRLEIPVESPDGVVPPLRIVSTSGQVLEGATANPRIVTARVTELRFVPRPGGAGVF
jgi:hypothetical protein